MPQREQRMDVEFPQTRHVFSISSSFCKGDEAMVMGDEARVFCVAALQGRGVYPSEWQVTYSSMKCDTRSLLLLLREVLTGVLVQRRVQRP